MLLWPVLWSLSLKVTSLATVAQASDVTPLERGTNELRRRIDEADASRKHLTPCFKCAVHICADGRYFRLTQRCTWKKDVGILGCLRYWVEIVVSHGWETACLNKVHINREPSGQIRVAMMVISKRRINEAYDVITYKLESNLTRSRHRDGVALGVKMPLPDSPLRGPYPVSAFVILEVDLHCNQVAIPWRGILQDLELVLCMH